MRQQREPTCTPQEPARTRPEVLSSVFRLAARQHGVAGEWRSEEQRFRPLLALAATDFAPTLRSSTSRSTASPTCIPLRLIAGHFPSEQRCLRRSSDFDCVYAHPAGVEAVPSASTTSPKDFRQGMFWRRRVSVLMCNHRGTPGPFQSVQLHQEKVVLLVSTRPSHMNHQGPK